MHNLWSSGIVEKQISDGEVRVLSGGTNTCNVNWFRNSARSSLSFILSYATHYSRRHLSNFHSAQPHSALQQLLGIIPTTSMDLMPCMQNTIFVEFGAWQPWNNFFLPSRGMAVPAANNWFRGRATSNTFAFLCDYFAICDASHEIYWFWGIFSNVI